MTSGVIGNTQGYQKQQVPSQRSHYSSSHPNKRRRATISSSKASAQSQHLPPTPTLATHLPPAVHMHRPSESETSESNSSPGDTKAPTDSSLPPCTPPVPNSSLNPPSLNGGGLALPFSPNFSFSPLPQFASLAPSPVPRPANLNQTQDQHHHTINFDPVLSMPPPPYDQQPTPGAGSTSGASAHTDPDSKDPFLSLLEQLAENEVSRGGPSELDFFLSGQSG